MHAVLAVDLEDFLSRSVFQHFVYACRAVTLRRFVERRQVLHQRDAAVFQFQVTGLIFLMVGVGDEHRGRFVKAQHAIGFRIADHRTFRRRLQLGVVRMVITAGERQAEDVLVGTVRFATG